MRTRSHLGWLSAATFCLSLAGCVDVTEGRYHPPSCKSLCEAAAEHANAGPDAAAEPAPEIPDRCDCGVDGGGQPNGSDGDISSGSCTDGAKNGTETDVDCGGSCEPCATGAQCTAASDCAPPLG